MAAYDIPERLDQLVSDAQAYAKPRMDEIKAHLQAVDDIIHDLGRRGIQVTDFNRMSGRPFAEQRFQLQFHKRIS